MTPLFGHKDEDTGDDVAALEAEIARVDGLAPARLAAEVMEKGFGADGPGGPGKPGTIEAPASGSERVGVLEITRRFTPAYTGRGVAREQQLRLSQLVEEGLQLLGNAALVRVSWRGGFDDYRATRAGRAALERGEVERAVATHSDVVDT
jgi:hypothetical protein